MALNLFDAQPVEVILEDNVPVIKKKPFVIIVTDRYLRFCYPAYTPEGLGYRSVEYLIGLDAERYARPWLLWAVLKVEATLRHALWALMRSLWRRGIIHSRKPCYQRFRWRDLRLGPDPRGKHR